MNKHHNEDQKNRPDRSGERFLIRVDGKMDEVKFKPMLEENLLKQAWSFHQQVAEGPLIYSQSYSIMI